MNVIKTCSSKIKNYGTAPVSTPDTPATTTPFPMLPHTKRALFFARDIWHVENRPGFARSSICGFAR